MYVGMWDVLGKLSNKNLYKININLKRYNFIYFLMPPPKKTHSDSTLSAKKKFAENRPTPPTRTVLTKDELLVQLFGPLFFRVPIILEAERGGIIYNLACILSCRL